MLFKFCLLVARRYFLGNWFVAFQCKVIYLFLQRSWGHKFVEKDTPHEINEHWSPTAHDDASVIILIKASLKASIKCLLCGWPAAMKGVYCYYFFDFLQFLTVHWQLWYCYQWSAVQNEGSRRKFVNYQHSWCNSINYFCSVIKVSRTVLNAIYV